MCFPTAARTGDNEGVEKRGEKRKGEGRRGEERNISGVWRLGRHMMRLNDGAASNRVFISGSNSQFLNDESLKCLLTLPVCV